MMNTSFSRALCALTLPVIGLCGWAGQSEAQTTALAVRDDSESEEPTKEDSWVLERDEQTGVTVRTMELTLHAKSEPRPALKYRLIPDDFDMFEGNAAVYYLKATGFLEQDWARDRLTRIEEEASRRAKEAGKGRSQVPPAVWRSTPPDELPLNEVKEHLQLTAFQSPFLREAARRDRFDADRNLSEVDDWASYLLPEIQAMRELARTQSLRCRVAIAEGRINDAIEITGQQFALARHLGQDDFVISGWHGIAIAGIAWNDALYLVQHPKTPNLYWAFATMPKPLVDLRHSLANERQYVYHHCKVLREVDETPRPASYWRGFLDRLVLQTGYGVIASELDLPMIHGDPPLARALLAAYIAAAYPGAREYLMKECELPVKQVDAYPIAQVVFLAAVRYYDRRRDDSFKWTHLPFWQAYASDARRGADDAMRAASERYGWCTAPTSVLLSSFMVSRAAEARCEQTIALIQTVEAIRMYGAAHDGKLPRSLDELPVPAPVEPFTGKPIDYECFGSRAVLDGHALPGLRYRLVLRPAEQSR